MKANNFTSYLNDAALLQDISYQELKSMVVQYPYCQNLRYLLVTKSHMEDRSEYQTDLHLAATYSIDRNFLFKHLYQEAYTQTSTESLVLEKEPEPVVEPVIEIPKEIIAVVAAAPLAKEVLDISKVTERRTIRIQSENAKLYAEQKAGLPDESVPSANFIEQLEEVENRIEPRSQEPEISSEPLVHPVKGDDSSDILLDFPIENPMEEEKKNLEENASLGELFEEDIVEGDVQAESMTDRTKLITYIEKPEPKESRSVIDQLMTRNGVLSEEDLKLIAAEEAKLGDELESLPDSAEEQGESPAKRFNEPQIHDVIFEITNDLPIYANSELTQELEDAEEVLSEPSFEIADEEEETFFESSYENGDEAPQEEHSDMEEEIFFESSYEDGDEAPKEEYSNMEEDDRPVPVPKTSFKDWKEKFLPDPSEDPPTEVSLEDILREDEENQIDAIIEEEVAEEKKKKEKKKKKKSKNKKEDTKKKKDSGKKKKKKKKKIIDIAKKSIQNNDDILSETLAELLVKQGSRKKAIQMYERLSLIFPEKSAFFAEKIEKIQR